MKKKLLCIILVLCFLLPLGGCSSLLINDKDTGEINKLELLNEFKDGTYYIFNRHYNNNGYVSYMILTVKKNIITKVEFNYIDNKSNILYKSDSTSGSADNIMFYIKNLNTSVISFQSVPASDDTKYDSIYKDYTALLSEAIPVMLKGEQKIVYANTEMKYSSVIKTYDSEGYNKKLSITLKDDVIVKIEFAEEDKDGLNKKNDNVYNSRFRSEYEVRYSDYIEKIVTPSINKERIVKSKGNLKIDTNFNNMADYLNKKLNKVDYRKIKKFKGI